MITYKQTLKKLAKIYSSGKAPAKRGKIKVRESWGQPLNGAAKYEDAQNNNQQIATTPTTAAVSTPQPASAVDSRVQQLARTNPSAVLGQRNLHPASWGTFAPPRNQKPGVVYFQDSRDKRWYPTTKDKILSLGFKFTEGPTTPIK